MFIIKGIEALVRTYNKVNDDWSGDEFTKDNPYDDQLTVLTKESLTQSLSNMLDVDIDFKHVYIQYDIVSISIIEDGDGYPDENGSFLVDYVFTVSKIDSVDVYDLLEGIE